jgi:hypothetical protein
MHRNLIEYAGLEHDSFFLEGTGAIVLDHEAQIAYATNDQAIQLRATRVSAILGRIR